MKIERFISTYVRHSSERPLRRLNTGCLRVKESLVRSIQKTEKMQRAEAETNVRN